MREAAARVLIAHADVDLVLIQTQRRELDRVRKQVCTVVLPLASELEHLSIGASHVRMRWLLAVRKVVLYRYVPRGRGASVVLIHRALEADLRAREEAARRRRLVGKLLLLDYFVR